MGARRAVEMVSGSIVVYLVMAACSADRLVPGAGSGDDVSSDDATTGDSAGTSSGSGSGSGATNASGSGSGILDALTDPVPNAMADNTQSGSRLKVNYYAGADGSKVPVLTMHDSQLGADCSYLTMSDGTTRCVPTAGATAASYFADSGCTQGLAYSTTCSGAPGYATRAANGGPCGAIAFHVFPVTGAFSGTAYSGTSANCVAVPSSSLASFSLFSLGSEMPPSMFVQATVQTAP